MRTFLDDNFLLETATAEQLFHDYAAHQPIIDYHNHLSPEEIACDKQFSTITQIWLEGDHYKWRAMRANGIDESYITGTAPDNEKFLKWAETVPYTIRNPLYHWTHLELQRYFDIYELLSPDSVDEIYDRANAALQSPGYSVLGLLDKMNVEVVCTTDDPTDSLEFHDKHMASGGQLKMLPTFRPDKFLDIGKSDFIVHLNKLEELVGHNIASFDELMSGLEQRVDHFHALGCQLADHGLSKLYAIDFTSSELDSILRRRMDDVEMSKGDIARFQTGVLHHLAKMYHERGWTMQLHLGPIRNNNSRLMNRVGADVGCDSIGDFDQAVGLSAFLNGLDVEQKLTKTILYNLNPRDNELFATMAGNFNDGTLPGKVQWGSAWWFLDQKDGMEKQLNTLSNMGLLSRFVGMLTDSRSFLSFPRHEYFRRILCNLIGRDVENGELPYDIEWLGEMVENICYRNARAYFDF